MNMMTVLLRNPVCAMPEVIMGSGYTANCPVPALVSQLLQATACIMRRNEANGVAQQAANLC